MDGADGAEGEVGGEREGVDRRNVPRRVRVTAVTRRALELQPLLLLEQGLAVRVDRRRRDDDVAAGYERWWKATHAHHKGSQQWAVRCIKVGRG